MSEPQIQLHRAGQRFLTQTDRVTSHQLFSFGEHYDPDNVGFGSLMVSNDEVVRPGPGYDDHPHADAEIITWVLSGSLVHEDSQGNTGLVYPGLAQRMSAGSGIVHAERNDAYRIDPTRPVEPVHLVQMWVRPDAPGAAPSYEQRELDLTALARQWVPVASGADPDAVVSLASVGSTLWATHVNEGVSRPLPADGLGHLYVASGQVEVESVGVLATGDSLRLRDAAGLRVSGTDAEAEVLLWEMTL
ncbi:MAG TPA: pirin family protein [Propionibacteriaceae bacterium]